MKKKFKNNDYYDFIDYQIYKRPNSRNWQIRFSLPGAGQIRLSLKTSNINNAKIYAQELYKQYFDHILGIEKKDIDFSTALAKYINASKAKNSSQYIQSKKNMAKVYLDFFGNALLSDIKQADILRFLVELKHKRLKPATINRYITFVKSLFNFCIDNDFFMGKNPLKKIKLFSETPRLEYFTEEQLIEIQKIAWNISGGAEEKNLRYYFPRLIHLLIKTGARFSEIANLKWSDITPHHIHIQKSKSGYGRLIDITPETFQIIKQLPQTRENIFELNQYSSDPFRRYWWKVLDKMGLPRKYKFHTLRHSFATNLLRMGYSITDIGELMGHRDIKTTMKYTHSTAPIKRQAITDYSEKTKIETISLLEHQKAEKK